MDDTIAWVAFWMLIIVSASPLVAAAIIGIWRANPYVYKPGHEHRYVSSDSCTFPKWPWKLHFIILAIAACGWLWVPWAALAGVKMYRANWNAVNYVNRPDEVKPVPGRVYRADEKPVEAQ